MTEAKQPGLMSAENLRAMSTTGWIVLAAVVIVFGVGWSYGVRNAHGWERILSIVMEAYIVVGLVQLWRGRPDRLRRTSPR